jgi:hypothetical protein
LSKSDVSEDKEKIKTSNLFENLVNALSKFVEEKEYNILDTLALSNDIDMAYKSIYNGLRNLRKENLNINYDELENDINVMFSMAKNNISILREIAIKALVKGYNRKEKPNNANTTGSNNSFT